MLITTTTTGSLLIQSGDDMVELTTDDALTLFGRLSGILPNMPAPEIERDDEHGWACPHCHAEVVENGSLVEHDSHQGESDIEIEDDAAFVNQSETERVTMAYLCGHCGKVVKIPGEISVNFG